MGFFVDAVDSFSAIWMIILSAAKKLFILATGIELVLVTVLV